MLFCDVHQGAYRQPPHHHEQRRVGHKAGRMSGLHRNQGLWGCTHLTGILLMKVGCNLGKLLVFNCLKCSLNAFKCRNSTQKTAGPLVGKVPEGGSQWSIVSLDRFLH